MNDPSHLRKDSGVSLCADAFASLPAAASAQLVNRTHRVIRQRAVSLQARQNTVRSLWAPLSVSAGLLALITFAVWSVLDQYDVVPLGLPDPGQQMLVFMMWCLPVSAVVLAVVWFRRDGGSAENGTTR